MGQRLGLLAQQILGGGLTSSAVGGKINLGRDDQESLKTLALTTSQGIVQSVA